MSGYFGLELPSNQVVGLGVPDEKTKPAVPSAKPTSGLPDTD
jgi:hypothetical protein